MAHDFLSGEWFAELEKLKPDAPEPTGSLKGLKVNFVVTGGPDGSHHEVHLDEGLLGDGPLDGATVKVKLPYKTAKAVLVDGSSRAAMTAVMTGKMKVEGDMTSLMALQSATAGADRQAFQKKIQSITT